MSEQQQAHSTTTESELIAVRRDKLAKIRELGIDPYGARFDVTTTPAGLKADFQEDKQVAVAGRLLAIRDMGKSQFFVIGDVRGKIQGFLHKNEVDETPWKLWKLLDRGDWVGIRGTTFLTRTGEPTVKVSGLTILSKSLRPLPDKWHGLADKEVTYRKRHLDLISNEESASLFVTRSLMIAEIRRFLQERGYLEVETPMLHPVAGGAAGIAIIGGADGPTAIFLSSKLSPNLMGAIAVCAYSYMALVPVIQPPLMRLLTTKKERVIRMKPARQVSQTEKIIFPIVGLLLTTFIVPSGLPLLGMLFFGNLLKESTKTTRLAKTAGSALNDVIVMLLGLTVGCSTQASEFLTFDTIKIFFLGALAFIIATASGVLFVKFFNLFLPKHKKINPLIGNAGVSAVPMAARISQNLGLEYDSKNYLLMHAMGPNVAGVIGSAVAAGVLLGFLS